MKSIKCSLPELIAEHRKLVKVLLNGNKQKLRLEATKQRKELHKYLILNKK